MNGMKRKAERRKREKAYTSEGLPIHANDWTADDWKDLHQAMEYVKRRVAERHANKFKEADTNAIL